MLVETFKKPMVRMRAQILDDVETTSNGEWCLTEGFERLSLHIDLGGATATAQVRLSNEPTPAATDDGVKLGADVSADAFVQLTVPARWVKVKITAHTGGGKKVNAYLEAA